MTAERSRTPDWLVERIALNELPAGELERAREKLLAEPDGRERLEAIARSNREILAAHPAEAFVREIERRGRTARKLDEATRTRTAVRWMAGLSVPLAAAAALVLMVQRTPSPGEDGAGLEPLEVTRLKGLPATLQIHRRGGETSERLKEGASARAGDVIQVGFTRGDRRFGAIVSIDGNGSVTRHLPMSGSRSASLSGSGLDLLDHAYELDDAPTFERFFLVTSDEPFELGPVLQAAEALAKDPQKARTGALELPAGLDQSAFVLTKVSP